MRIALVHYHLRSGGVTSVILNQARSLTAAGMDILIIAGEPPVRDGEFSFALVSELAYDAHDAEFDARKIESGAALLADGIIRAMKEHWGREADIVHIHNPLIQKNTLLIPAIKTLAARGIKLFLQNHDLAEDFRPDVYTGQAEYPENCHYGVINSRDYNFLLASGLSTQGLHLIPNEVFPLTSRKGLRRTRFLYPVRAIRRKNIGEALLLSLFIPEGTTIAITLPASQKDDERYQRWRSLASELNLPVEFALGLQYSLEELLGTSLCAITTSVKEGFGFSFLEPWTAALPLFGRRIAYVCADFEKSGIRFDHLYPSLDIPFDYVSDMLPGKLEAAIRRIYAAFAYEVPPAVLRELSEDMKNRDTADFGQLDEPMQETVIRKVFGNSDDRLAVRKLNPVLEVLADLSSSDDLIRANCKVIAGEYGQERITALLLDIYGKVIGTPVIQKISKSALLKLFLTPRSLFLTGISDE